jgi:hypothetical protein
MCCVALAERQQTRSLAGFAACPAGCKDDGVSCAQDGTAGGLRCVACQGNLAVLNNGQCGEFAGVRGQQTTKYPPAKQVPPPAVQQQTCWAELHWSFLVVSAATEAVQRSQTEETPFIHLTPSGFSRNWPQHKP